MENVRITITFLFRRPEASARQFARAKSAYASSTMTTPGKDLANAATSSGSRNSPVGAFGFVSRKSEAPAFPSGPTHLTFLIAASVL